MCLVAWNIIKHFTLHCSNHRGVIWNDPCLLQCSWGLGTRQSLYFHYPLESRNNRSDSWPRRSRWNLRHYGVFISWKFYILPVHSEIRWWVHCLERIEGCQEFALEYSKHLWTFELPVTSIFLRDLRYYKFFTSQCSMRCKTLWYCSASMFQEGLCSCQVPTFPYCNMAWHILRGAEPIVSEKFRQILSL